MYKILEGMSGIPNTYGLLDYNNKSRILVMDKMGPSLETLFKRCGRRFSLKTVLMIVDQMLRIIEYVHNCGILHRDIKPQNFLIGRSELHNRIYLIDYGVSTFYIDPRTHEHVMYTSNNGLIGTAYYVSINTHLGDQQSRRDDLESIAYVLIRFLKGSLPWQNFKAKNVDERNEKITQNKIQTTPDMLCSGLPKEFKIFLEHIRKLKYDETPKYHTMRQLFMNLFIKKGYVYDGLFDWDEEATIHRPLPIVYLNSSASRCQRHNERQICNRKSKVQFPEPRSIFLFGWRK
ncbi:CK1 family protein kinase [Histomonas meleagridis]|uniref:CK1 family protein kinase n=1 Tax=Histomonas meleagridis TaxID=135588 RepID=UPI003559AED9|nr:CK1 family protein kinase [Histomonas meleagridis]KAH0796390.1 CK1 family protein kinase [Histomonas meleagridis]